MSQPIAIAAPARPWTKRGLLLTTAGREPVTRLGHMCTAAAAATQGTGLPIALPSYNFKITTAHFVVPQDHPPRELLR